ncbi:hypothetical protein CFC35_22395 [Streptomyces sp. FBKL.4005]|nr:hypothetical protein CFC35_22395 [Streptomyces sp. FBKL.4005]
MRHTVRRSCRGVEQTGVQTPIAQQGAARTARSGTAPGAPPARLVRAATRIPHKVPERPPDSGP